MYPYDLSLSRKLELHLRALLRGPRMHSYELREQGQTLVAGKCLVIATTLTHVRAVAIFLGSGRSAFRIKWNCSFGVL